MPETSSSHYSDDPASVRDRAAPIRLALAASAVLAVALVVWNVFAALH